MNRAACLLIACALCIEWTRLTGVVKGINLKNSTVTIELKTGDLLTVPVDYQVSLTDKHGELRSIKTIYLDEKITFLHIPSEPPKDDTEGLAPPEPSAHGR